MKLIKISFELILDEGSLAHFRRDRRAEQIRMLLITQLKMNICVFCLQCIEQPGHQIADFALRDVVVLVPHSPGEDEETQGVKLPEDVDNLRHIHNALTD